MPSNRVVRVKGDGDPAVARVVEEGIARIQEEQGIDPEFPPEVEEAAARAAANPRLPELDRTDLPFITIDPESARDLDQALHISRAGDGYVVHYAIADVAAFVSPGDPIDVEAHKRGETLYGADRKVPLHPKVISEDAGSLLEGEVRPALLWTIQVDETGEGTDVHVERALVRSTAKLSYEGAQRAIDGGSADEVLLLLKEIGELRLHRDAMRGGVSLPLPEQEIDIRGEHWALEFRQMEPVELWNAQISLLTGFGAASLMVYARVGVLRTMPPPDPRDIQRLHRTAKALGLEWPAEQLYPDFIRSLDPTVPAQAAMVVASARLLRGSGYVAFDGEVPAEPQHSALASEYAHVTAPLRRLGDRYAGEICVALCAGVDVPDWVVAKLHELPRTLQASGQRANRYERSILDLVEAGVLSARVGDTFDAVVVEVAEDDPTRGELTVPDPAVEARVVGSADLPLGQAVKAKLTRADVETRSVEFAVE